MSLLAVIHATDVMRTVLLPRSQGSNREETFALSFASWKPRVWQVCVMLDGQVDAPAVVGLSLVHPGRKVADHERAVRIASFRPVVPPLPLAHINGRLDKPTRKAMVDDGPLTAARSATVASLLKELHPDIKGILAELDGLLSVNLPPGKTGEILSQERDAFGVMLEAAGFDRNSVLSEWQMPEGPDASTLMGINNPWAGERQQVAEEMLDLVGWPLSSPMRRGWCLFSRINGDTTHHLFAYNASDGPAERATGVDLIYYHVEHRSFVLVQYKMMKMEGSEWRYRPSSDSNLESELGRMRIVDLACSGASAAPEDSRLLATPCFVKLCESLDIVPKSGSLVPGMYLPRGDFENLCSSRLARGPKGGSVLGPKTIPRHLSNTTFAQLLGDGWIGSRGTGTEYLMNQIMQSISRGRAAAVGIRSTTRT